MIDLSPLGSSIFIGTNAGANDDFSTNQNTFVGHQSGKNNTTGSNNVYLAMTTAIV